MARDLFGEVTTPTKKLGSEAWYTVPMSIAVHVVLLACVVVVPLMSSDVLPMPTAMTPVWVETRLPDPPPPPAAPVTAATRAPEVVARTAAPIEPPSSIGPEITVPPAVPYATEGGFGTGTVTPGAGSLNVPVVPLPPPPVRPPDPVRPGGVIKYPTKVHHVPPVYPRLAQDAKVEGLVILEAIIAVDGRVQDVKILRSKPLLDQAAIDAVRQWRFTPTLLNGVPVPVIMTVTVKFELR